MATLIKVKLVAGQMVPVADSDNESTVATGGVVSKSFSSGVVALVQVRAVGLLSYGYPFSGFSPGGYGVVTTEVKKMLNRYLIYANVLLFWVWFFHR